MVAQFVRPKTQTCLTFLTCQTCPKDQMIPDDGRTSREWACSFYLLLSNSPLCGTFVLRMKKLLRPGLLLAAVLSAALPLQSLTSVQIGTLAADTLIAKTGSSPDSLRDAGTTLLRDFVVEGYRSTYDPDNPGLWLVQAAALAERAKDERLDSLDFAFLQSDRLTLSLSNFKLESSFLNKLFPFFREYVLPSKLDGSWTLPLSRRFALSEFGHDAASSKLSEVVRYKEHVGLDENLDDGTMSQSLEELFPHIDIFGDHVLLLENQFISPFSIDLGPRFYKYYLTDTLIYRGKVSYGVEFRPKDKNSPSFAGRLIISAGYPPRLQNIVFTVPDERNLNFLDGIRISQDFGPSDPGKSSSVWTLQSENLSASFKLYRKLLSLYVEQERSYTGYDFAPPDTLLSLRAETPALLDLSSEPEAKAIGAAMRRRFILVEDDGLKQFLAQIKSFPLYKTLIDASDMVSRGYIRTMWRHDKVFGGSKVDIGPIGAVWGRNTTEGVRLRLGARTTGYFHDRLFAEGYLAYGFSDKRWKYSGTLTYSFNKKRYFRQEYPQHELSLTYQDDIYLPGQTFQNDEKDNILYNLGTAYLTNRSYRKLARLEYLNDIKAGLRVKVSATRFVDTPVEGGGYVRVRRAGSDTTLIRVPSLTDFAVFGEIRWAPGERIYNGSMQRESPFFRRFQREVPVFFLRHEMGLPVWGGEVRRHKTEFSVEHRLWMGKAGRMDYHITLGKIWNPVPYPLLYTPPVNRAFWLNEHSFQVMTPYELIGDEWASAFVQWHLRGLLLGHIGFLKGIGPPFIVLSANYLYGNTSKQNRQDTRTELFVLPTISTEMRNTHYAEVGIGIENILKVIRIDLFRRLTPPISPVSPSPWVVRAKIGVTF